jgi:microcystin-dependent protein
VQQLPQHNHLAGVTAAYGTVGTPSNAILGATNSGTPTAPVAGNLDFTTSAPDANLASNALAMSGGAAPHNNIQPSVVVNFIISLFGIYPSQA